MRGGRGGRGPRHARAAHGRGSAGYRWRPNKWMTVGYVDGVGATVKTTFRGLRIVRSVETPTVHGATRHYGRFEFLLADEIWG